MTATLNRLAENLRIARDLHVDGDLDAIEGEHYPGEIPQKAYDQAQGVLTEAKDADIITVHEHELALSMLGEGPMDWLDLDEVEKFCVAQMLSGLQRVLRGSPIEEMLRALLGEMDDDPDTAVA